MGGRGKGGSKDKGAGRAKGSGRGKGGAASTARGHFEPDPAGAIAVLPREDVERAPHLVPEVEYVSSFNFVDCRGVTPEVSRLVVPGLPRSFAGDRDSVNLTPDVNDVIADENHLQIPQYPTEPIFAAVRELQPDFKFEDVDMVCQSNDLRKLLGFLGGDCSSTSILIGANNERDSSFRLDVDVLAREHLSCVVLTRNESKDVVESHFLPKNTFAKSFEIELTDSAPLGGKIGNVSTYRIVNKVRLGSLTLLVQSEIDACDYNDYKPSIGEDSSIKQIETKCPSVQVCHAGDSGIVNGGTMLELKLKSVKSASRIEWDAYFFQMLFSGAGGLVLGIHNAGVLQGKPKLYSLDDVRELSQQKAPDRIDSNLSKLHTLLGTVCRIAHGHGQLKILCDGVGGPLVIKARNEDGDEPRVLG